MIARRTFGSAALGTAAGAVLAGLFQLVGAYARRYEGAESLAASLDGSTGLWHAIAVEAPLRTLPALLATALALRVLAKPLARDGALVGAFAALGAFGVQARMHPVDHAVFAAFAAVTFGAALGAGAAEKQVRPKASSPLALAWIAHTGAVATSLAAPTPRGRAAVLLAAVLAVSLMAAHAFLQRRDRRLRDDVGATFSLASRTLQSLTPWHLRNQGIDELSLRWITFGVFTTVGLLVTACVAAAVAGRALGLDFATFEQEGGASSADLAFVGAFVLAAFALAGWLLGRAASLRAAPDSILGPLLVVPVAVVALPTGRVGFLVTVAFAFTAALFTAAGAVMARRTTS